MTLDDVVTRLETLNMIIFTFAYGVTVLVAAIATVILWQRRGR